MGLPSSGSDTGPLGGGGVAVVPPLGALERPREVGKNGEPALPGGGGVAERVLGGGGVDGAASASPDGAVRPKPSASSEIARVRDRITYQDTGARAALPNKRGGGARWHHGRGDERA